MGAIIVEERVKSSSPEEGFQKLAEAAVVNSGDSYYNGDFNNTRLIKSYPIEKSKLNKEIARLHEELNKGECVCLILKQPKIKPSRVKFTNKPVVGKSKWVTKYEVQTFMGEVITSFPDKVSSVNYAKKKSLEIKEKLNIVLTKKLEGNNIVGSVEFISNPKSKDGEFLYIACAPM